jgi:hypothetical protein
MNTERLSAIAVLVVAVAALGGAAATLDGSGLTGWGSEEKHIVGEPTGGNGTPTERPEADPSPEPSSSEQSTTDDSSAFSLSSFWMPPGWILVGAFLVALGGSIALLYTRSGSTASFEGEVEDDDRLDLDRVGEVAGGAADRIERQADASNEVFRAWREMVQLLEIDDPETTTPAEFEARAVAAGMDAEDVAELTALFREVRYGAFQAGEREDDAVAALRRIEAAHTTDAAEGEQP